jgi:hypothetical protein
MGWKLRNGRRFYYRSTRIGAVTRSVYVGGGARGEQAAREDSQRRLQRRSDEIQLTIRLVEFEAAGEPLRALEASMAWLVRAVLVLAGHYLHRGHEWRRRAA